MNNDAFELSSGAHNLNTNCPIPLRNTLEVRTENLASTSGSPMPDQMQRNHQVAIPLDSLISESNRVLDEANNVPTASDRSNDSTINSSCKPLTTTPTTFGERAYPTADEGGPAVRRNHNEPRGSLFKYNDPNSFVRVADNIDPYASIDIEASGGIFIHGFKLILIFLKRHSSSILSNGILAAYLAYFAYAMVLKYSPGSRGNKNTLFRQRSSTDFIVLTSIIVAFKVTNSQWVKRHIFAPVKRVVCCVCLNRQPVVPTTFIDDDDNNSDSHNSSSHSQMMTGNKRPICRAIRSNLYLIALFLVLCHLGYEVYLDPMNKLPPAGGLVILVIITAVFSRNFKKINWRTVTVGLTLQILAADFVMKVPGGSKPFIYIGNKMSQLMKITDNGSEFVFGEKFKNHPLAFQAMPVVIFLSSLIAVFSYLGILDWIVNIGSLLFRWTMKTKKIESLCAISNIFLGQVEAFLLFRDKISQLSNSELLATMIAGMASISGINYAIYLNFNVSPVYLFAANIMAAPGSLVVAKILLPETEKSQSDKIETNMDTDQDEDLEDDTKSLDKKKYRNIIEAFTDGASTAVPIVMCVIGIMIVFVAMQTLLDDFFAWFFSQIGIEDLTFRTLLAYFFLPFTWLTGIPYNECKHLGSLLGTKFLANEFLAYVDLKKYVDDGILSPKSIVIATFALCGCTNIGSIGVQLGTISLMAPNKMNEVGKLVFLALYGAFVANLISACIAAILYSPNATELVANGILLNSTQIFTNLTNESIFEIKSPI